MKFFCLLYAIYILALSIVPCGDACDNNPLTQTITTEAQSAKDHHHEDEGCSPFCICPCCGTVCSQSCCTLLYSEGNYTTTLHQPGYENIFLQEIYFSIWQPPKIS